MLPFATVAFTLEFTDLEDATYFSRKDDDLWEF